MSTRCTHPNVQAVDHKRLRDLPRTVWVCQDCGVTWPADPRELAAAHDGLADRITAAIHTAGEPTPPAAILDLLVDVHRRARDLLDLALVDTGGADLDMDSFDAGIQYGTAATLQVLADHGILRDDNGSTQ